MGAAVGWGESNEGGGEMGTTVTEHNKKKKNLAAIYSQGPLMHSAYPEEPETVLAVSSPFLPSERTTARQYLVLSSPQLPLNQ